MAKLSQAQEPSMEEILASIRRIISDEETTGRDRPAPALSVVHPATGSPDRRDAEIRSAEPTPTMARAPTVEAGRTGASPDDSSILELTEADVSASLAVPSGMERDMDIAFADPPRAAPSPAPMMAPPPAAAPDARDEPRASHVSEPGPNAFSFSPSPPRPATPDAPATAQDVPMLREPLLSQRSDEAVNSAFNHLAHTMLSANARTLEDLVKDMMRPMLKTWLDDNLPPLVERLVREEIERVSRGGRR